MDELDDRNKLSELSIFRTYDEARNYNSDVELTKLKTKQITLTFMLESVGSKQD